MKLANASYQLDYDGVPFLEVFLDGQPARIGEMYEQKFLDRDVVFLGPSWEERTEEIVIPAEDVSGAPEGYLGRPEMRLLGYVRDARLARMVREFRAVKWDDFRPGPVAIPPEEEE